ncbi:hypothetical protein KSZ_57390 [Dictyobacter formicarum]|uniref:Uncharacterized protein n=1 Tax=Dictyobacter formicarum TaxID=2778368 RepID=A0ABQ3VPH8_9CHLR|nr:hypothetical protein KSZ_57390 [Dictyobacter formicarum]
MDTDIKTYSTRFGNSRTTFKKPILAQNRCQGSRIRHVAGPEQRKSLHVLHLASTYRGVDVETGVLGQLIGAFIAARNCLTNTDRAQADKQVDNLDNDMG